MDDNKKIAASDMLERFQIGAVLLAPLVVKSCALEPGPPDRADARIELVLPSESEGFRFAVEVKARATPQMIRLAMTNAKAAVQEGEWPMIQVPFLSPERLDDLEKENVSGVDLCGNGVVIVPGRIFVRRSGAPNRYRDSRPLNNPYRGRSAMVARMLLQRPRWESLKDLTSAIQTAGVKVSLGQASKATQALTEEMIVAKTAGVISLADPLRLLDNLGREWRKPVVRTRQALRLPANTDLARAFSSAPQLQWAMTGSSSVTRYAMFGQGGPHRLAVSSLSRAMELLGGVPEPAPNFADVELLETEEPGFYFGNEIDESGIRWASRLQTWLELQSGDARQQEAAQELRTQILKDARG